VARDAALEVLARADRAATLPQLGGMARPNGVVILSERYWAFATTDGGLREGTIPSPRRPTRRIPLLRGLLQLTHALRPLLRGEGVAAPRERVFLLAALVLPLVLLPQLPARAELPVGLLLTACLVLWLMRGRTLRLHGAEHRAIAAVERRRLAETWAGTARPSRFATRCGTNFAALALPVTAAFDRLWPWATMPVVSTALVVALSLGATMELWRAVQHPSGLLRGLVLPGLALQRLTTREPRLEDTQVALRAAASVLRRELEG
jgi:Protein of unknown function (DUF1385)